MSNPTHLEVEVKFHVTSLAEIRARLLHLGATQKKPRVYERNIVYDTADVHLRQNRQLLRLRQDETVRLTFKGQPPEQTQRLSEAKVREELELHLDDFATAEKILTRLGFIPQIVYEKYRETFHLGRLEIVLDELPYGHFIELEGDETEMKPLATKLGLAWHQRILTNYLGLMAQLKTTCNLPFNDLTFENFSSAKLPPNPFEI